LVSKTYVTEPAAGSFVHSPPGANSTPASIAAQGNQGRNTCQGKSCPSPGVPGSHSRTVYHNPPASHDPPSSGKLALFLQSCNPPFSLITHCPINTCLFFHPLEIGFVLHNCPSVAAWERPNRPVLARTCHSRETKGQPSNLGSANWLCFAQFRQEDRPKGAELSRKEREKACPERSRRGAKRS